MKFSYQWLKELVPFKESPEALAKFLTMRVFEVEGLEKAGDDHVLDIKILPNRMADASGHIGMAREIASLKKSKIQIPNHKQIPNTKLQTKNFLRITVEDAKDCSRYSARVMDGVKIGPSPAWMRARLSACGLQSINNVVDAANYVMLETGQPLHVFDFDKIKDVEMTNDKLQITNKSQNPKPKTIRVRRARKGERITGLDDKTYELNPDILVIADEKNPIAVAGIKGGRESGVSQNTTRIVLESANFDPVVIRRTAQALALRTDASMRFQHGLDPNETPFALDRLAMLIRKVAGGAILSGMADRYPRKATQHAILFRPAYAERMIGEKISTGFYRSAFARLGWTARSKGKDFVIMPPHARRDIEIEEDIVEEIARLFDYQNIRPAMPETVLATGEKNTALFWEELVRDALVGAGFIETELYQFSSAEEHSTFGIDRQTAVALENPQNPQMAYLTPMIALRYVLSTAQNLRGHDTVKIFGIQKEFRRGKDGGVEEAKKLVIVSAHKDAKVEHFYALKGVLDTLWECLGLHDVAYTEEAPHVFAHPHRAAAIIHDGKKIGALRELHPALAEKIKARGQILFAAIPFAEIAKRATAESEYRPVGKFPAITRDIAIVVSEDIRADDVTNVVENTGGALLTDTDLFDYFQDDALKADGEKSLAFHLIFQSSDRTLTDVEIDAIMQKITADLKERGWDIKA
ncbi:MAG: phenylalanine--tRNA ligase subunit beta [Patescibacteria group bacterium]